jgi:hypothetical protein
VTVVPLRCSPAMTKRVRFMFDIRSQAAIGGPIGCRPAAEKSSLMLPSLGRVTGAIRGGSSAVS